MKPENVTRIAQIAMAIEPIPNKVGLTTRYEDKVDTLKLEYFVISAINSGNRIYELMCREKFTPSYDLLTQKLTARGITYITVQNSYEDWISDFDVAL